MKIHSILRRPVPPVIDLGTATYTFEANEKGDHVCEIEDEAHIRRLVVEIPEGYRVYDGKPLPKPAPTAAVAHENILVTAQRQRQEQEARELAAAEAANNAALKPIVIKHPDGRKIDLAVMEKQELALFAANEMGIKVHHKWAAETLRAKIIEATRVE